jgi:quinol monooxygenase YgiN
VGGSAEGKGELMSTVAVLEVIARPERAGELKKLFLSLLPSSRAFEGCLGISLHEDQDDPCRLLFVERWVSREDHQRYSAWRRERGDTIAIAGLTAGPPVVRYFSVVDEDPVST